MCHYLCVEGNVGGEIQKNYTCSVRVRVCARVCVCVEIRIDAQLLTMQQKKESNNVDVQLISHVHIFVVLSPSVQSTLH